jgi:hypothetical protein
MYTEVNLHSLGYYMSNQARHNNPIIPINNKQLMMYFHIPTAYEKNIPTAMALLNSYEKAVKFKQSVLHKATLNKDTCYLMLGSSQWMKRTPLVSIYVSLFRLALITGKETLEECIKEFNTESYRNSNDFHAFRDIPVNHFKVILNHLRLFLKAPPKKYSGITGNTARTTDIWRLNTHSTVGIMYLLENMPTTNYYTKVIKKLIDDARNQT